MFEPVRGGTRGGQAEFKWSDVSADKDRENYLGHSINAPTGRWQKNKDVHWYNRDKDLDGDAAKAEEIRKIKELEAEALATALGYEPTKPGSKPPADKNTTSSGANAVPVASTSTASNKYRTADLDPDAARRKMEKEERRKMKEARREEKRARKEEKRLKRGDDRDDHDRERDRPRRHPSRSRSPVRRAVDNSRSRSRSRSPRRYGEPEERRYIKDRKPDPAYDEQERKSERERDRMRWELNARREMPRDDRERDRDRRRW